MDRGRGMLSYNRLQNGGYASSPSPPHSPSRSPRLRHGKGRGGRFPAGIGGPRGFLQRVTWILLSVLLRRQAVFLFAPVIYIAIMLYYMGSVVPTISDSSVPGSVYRSHDVFSKLWPEIFADNSSSDALHSIWRQPHKAGQWKPCINWTSEGDLPDSNGLLYIEANGGLNQQRTSICNAVAMAGYLNATLVLPNFHYHSVWRDPRVIRISPFANRLSMDAPPSIQKLRCLANYEALRFSKPITALAETLVNRMKMHSINNDGKYVAVHLRFEKDMVAFSCCIYDGGKKEKLDMDAAREKGWHGKFTRRGRVIRPGANRLSGKCPLTPLEVGLMLRGMGFGNTTSIYLASGKIYESERTMVPLRQMFPLLHTKDTLASPEELAPFKKYSSRMAAIDYSVCLHSEVFVTTQGGNFPHFQMGHRRYLYGGHAKTIRPDKRKLALLLSNPNIGWKTFKKQMASMGSHSDAKGFGWCWRLYNYPLGGNSIVFSVCSLSFLLVFVRELSGHT